MIGNITEPERMTLTICAARNGGACHCAKVWGYPREMIGVCAALLAQVKAGVETVKAEGER